MHADLRAADGQNAEHCTGEVFEPRCHGNDVIVMLSARYGRMKIGKCVKREPGFEPMLQDPRYLGCSTDVLHILSSLCSGRSECTVRVKDQTFNNVKPCYDNLKMYLEMAYICVSGMTNCIFYFIKCKNMRIAAFRLVLGLGPEVPLHILLCRRQGSGWGIKR